MRKLYHAPPAPLPYIAELQRPYEEAQRAINAADTSHLDNKRIEQRADEIKRETEKALLVRVGYWNGWNKEMWLPKSKIEFLYGGRRFFLIPVWLAKEKGIPFTINTPMID
ncbi:MAG TPA: hypothetical protein VJ464_01320 [Blastocatellia bacterium]|nr:hypothetical protein [Blastocatellia bacterium]